MIERSFFSTYHRWELGADVPSYKTIEEALSERLPHIDPRTWPERFNLGGVYAGGKPAHLGDALKPPCRLEYYEPCVSLEDVPKAYPLFSADAIIHCDDDLAVVVKPAGLPTTAARDQQLYNLHRYLELHFRAAVHLPSRLDTGVGGLLLVSRSARMNRFLQRAFDRRAVQKVYYAEVCGTPRWDEAVCSEPIERDPLHPVLRRCGATSPRSEAAETYFKCLGRYEMGAGPRSLIEARPKTGRTHQIRLHCQFLGVPIIGDPFYGNPDEGGIRLVSYRLSLHHPYLNRTLEVSLREGDRPAWIQNV